MGKGGKIHWRKLTFVQKMEGKPLDEGAGGHEMP